MKPLGRSQGTSQPEHHLQRQLHRDKYSHLQKMSALKKNGCLLSDFSCRLQGHRKLWHHQAKGQPAGMVLSRFATIDPRCLKQRPNGNWCEAISYEPATMKEQWSAQVTGKKKHVSINVPILLAWHLCFALSACQPEESRIALES